jgi:hypothetical protein
VNDNYGRGYYMSFESKPIARGSEKAEPAATDFDPHDPIEVSEAEGSVDNPGTSTVTVNQQFLENPKSSAPAVTIKIVIAPGG